MRTLIVLRALVAVALLIVVPVTLAACQDVPQQPIADNQAAPPQPHPAATY